ncbi:MAG: molybdopterin biosynthesis protein [Desulfurococcaceae archaeon]
MPAEVFHKLTGLDETLKLIVEKVRPAPKGVEEVSIEDALLRVLASNIYAPMDYPPFDRSEVDGYAVKSPSTAYATELSPVALPLAGSLKAGDPGTGYRCVDSAVQVSTGAVVPLDCDAVIMDEHTERAGNYVKVYRSVAPGENISTAGSDISAGDFLLPEGLVLRHRHIALLAGLGVLRVPVYIKPKIAVYSTGAELAAPGSPLSQGKVYDVNGYLISSFLRELGADASFKGVLPDDYRLVREAIERDLSTYDAIFTSGGTSAGESDVVYRVFGDLGEIVVHGLKSKPGKPTVVASSGGKILFGLPGFPLSCYMILVRVVEPLIAMLTGAKFTEETLNVRLPIKLRKDVGKTWLVPSIVVESERGYVAYPVSLSSGSIYSITYSDGFVELGEDVEVLNPDSAVPLRLFVWRGGLHKLVIIGSNDPLLEFTLVKTGLIYVSKVLNTGSVGGWIAVSRGEADIAPTHLLDPESGKYNTPFLDKYGLSERAVLIRGYDRLIGFVTAKGNPKRIGGFDDFFREDIKVVNRPRGAGIRALIDSNLKKIAAERGIKWSDVPSLIRGYTYEVKTHTAVALAVKQGRADVGVAVGYVAEIYGLDFTPIGWEEYDLLVLRNRVDKPGVAKLLDALKSGEFIEKEFRFKKYYRFPSNTGYPRGQ